MPSHPENCTCGTSKRPMGRVMKTPTALFEAYEERMRADRVTADAPGEDRDPDERGSPWSAEDGDTENTR